MDERDERARSARRADWMQRVQQGDREAYRALLDDVAPALTGFLRRRTVDPQDLDDVYQETLLALHRVRHTYEPSRPFEPWLFGIARHVAADHARRRRRRTRREVVTAMPPEAVVEGDGGVPRQLEQALAGLSPVQRETIELLQLEGLPLEAAAVRLGATTGAVKVRAHRAYKALRRLLAG
jgi:RNA polymerase sigma-70 factor (ECF subfamily)